MVSMVGQLGQRGCPACTAEGMMQAPADHHTLKLVAHKVEPNGFKNVQP